jgi:NAD(P)-dependent dehydrogenase (short-subunit alcohol dehydrogenase family)
MQFDGEVALIVGGGSGMGEAAAELLSERGATVVVADLAGDRAAAIADRLVKRGRSAMGISVDVTSPESVSACVARAVETFGGLDVLIHTAGITQVKKALDITYQDLKTMVEVDLYGPFLMCQQVAKHMVDRGRGGRIALVASIAGLSGNPGCAHYNAAKHAVVGMTKAFAIEWGPFGIRVNCLCPGTTLTPMLAGANVDVTRIPLGKAGTAVDQANALAFLVGPESGHITGTVLVVDGGSLAITGHVPTPALTALARA